MQATKVYLVGSGPGSLDLLTIKAKALLEHAHVVIYDALVGDEILSLASRAAKLIYVGKRAGRHAMRQEEINQTIIETARTIGGVIVRLKGGDPFVFGRGGEEMQALARANIAYEVVPGVTAGIAAAAYCGIPVTHRGVSRSVTLVTAFSEDGGVPDLDWAALVRLQGTLVFYMSMRVVPYIAQQLIAYGMEATTSAAIISQATLPSQQLHTADLSTYQDASQSYEVYAPGLWVVGDVVRFAQSYQWLEVKPLLGKRILVTRAEAQSSKLVALLQERGATVKLLPTIQILPNEGWEDDKALWQKPKEGSWLVFTSANGVHEYMRGLGRRGLDSRFLAGYSLAVVGPATAEALRGYSLSPDLMPRGIYTAQGLAEALLRHRGDMPLREVLLPTSRLSSGELTALLQEAGVRVRELFLYDNAPIQYTRGEVQELFDVGLDWITFCSSSAVHHFMDLIERLGLRAQMSDVSLAAIGPITAEALREYGLYPRVEPQEATLPALVAAIENA